MNDISQADAAKQLLAIKKASLSFPGFLDYYYPKFKRAPFQNEFVDVLDQVEKDALVSKGGNPIRNLLISMPPRHAKSFYGTINLPAYALMRKPYREVMVSGYNAELAGTFGRGTRDIVTDARAQRAFKGFELSRETRAVDFWKTMKGGAYYAVGIGGTTTGRGANFLVVDDPIKSREDADSSTIRRKIWDFYTASLHTRLQPDQDGQPPFQIVTMTRWHPDDLAGRIMESPEFKRGEWLHLNFQALTKKGGGVYIHRNDLPVDDPAHVPAVSDVDGKKKELTHHYMTKASRMVSAEKEVALWPERFPVEVLHQKRESIGEREFAALFQQSPYVLGGNIIKENWFQRYKPENLPENFHAVVITLDTAFKTATVNDYSVATVGGIMPNGDIYILKVYRDKLEYPDLKKKMTTINATWRGRGLRGWWVEDAASGQSLIQDMKQNSGLTILPWRPGSSDKTNRATSISPLIEGGRVFIPEESDWVDDWLNEIVSFPSVKHDDQVDSFVIMMDVLSRMVVVGMSTFDAPIGQFVAEKKLTGDLLFGNAELRSDPMGWRGGAGGFGSAAEAEMQEWKGWGV